MDGIWMVYGWQEDGFQPVGKADAMVPPFHDFLKFRIGPLVFTENLIRSARLPAMRQILPAR